MSTKMLFFRCSAQTYLKKINFKFEDTKNLLNPFIVRKRIVLILSKKKNNKTFGIWQKKNNGKFFFGQKRIINSTYDIYHIFYIYSNYFKIINNFTLKIKDGFCKRKFKSTYMKWQESLQFNQGLGFESSQH